MRAWLLGIVLTTAAPSWGSPRDGGPVSLTSGWLSVLDVPDARRVTSADETVAVASLADAGQVLLLGAMPGLTTVSVWTSTDRRTDFEVSVTRFATLQRWDGMVQVNAGHRRTLRVPSLSRVAVGDASISDAVIAGPDELDPRSAGTTSVIVWTGARRWQLLVTVVSGGVVRSVDDFDAVLTEPLDGRQVLIAGERLALEAPAVTRFAVLDPSVARVHLQGRELVIEGVAAGATRLLVWTCLLPQKGNTAMQLHRTAALLAVLATAALAQGRPLPLAVGSQKILTLPGIQRVALGDSAIADVKTIGNQELLVVGLTAGHTTLLVWRSGATSPERFDLTVSGSGSVAAQPVAPPETTPAPTFTPTLKLGERTTRAAANLQRIAIGDPGIADLSTANDTVTVVGVSAGKTNVLLWFVDGHREQWQVTVVK